MGIADNRKGLHLGVLLALLGSDRRHGNLKSVGAQMPHSGTLLGEPEPPALQQIGVGPYIQHGSIRRVGLR